MCTLFLQVCVYIYIYIYMYVYRCWNTVALVLFEIGNLTSQDFDILLRSFCADSSPPKISAIFVGHFTWGKNNSLRVSAILRKTSATIAETNVEIQARKIPYCEMLPQGPSSAKNKRTAKLAKRG